ncbi:hypothetical protein B0H10DRAFT_1957796 [Mycena sp. CBHHK59/15]|nr:hypothetical protein B0H10DRAFT_1957796 [Mycena sp. CBHHK59/15]
MAQNDSPLDTLAQEVFYSTPKPARPPTAAFDSAKMTKHRLPKNRISVMQPVGTNAEKSTETQGMMRAMLDFEAYYDGAVTKGLGLSHIRRGWHREWCTAFNTSFLTTGRFWAHTFGSDHGLLGLLPIHGDLPFGKIPCWCEWLETRDGGGFWAHTFGSIMVFSVSSRIMTIYPWENTLLTKGVNTQTINLGSLNAIGRQTPGRKIAYETFALVALLFSTPLVMARPSPDSPVTLLVVPEFEGFEGINSILAIGTAAGVITGGTDPATETIIESSGGYTLIDAPVFTDHFNSVTTVLRTDVEGRCALLSEGTRRRAPWAELLSWAAPPSHLKP